MLKLKADTKAMLGGFAIIGAFVILPITSAAVIHNLSEDDKPKSAPYSEAVESGGYDSAGKFHPVQPIYQTPAPVYNLPRQPLFPDVSSPPSRQPFGVPVPEQPKGPSLFEQSQARAREWEAQRAIEKQAEQTRRMQQQIDEANKRACEAQKAAAELQRKMDGYRYMTYSMGCH